MLLRPEEDALLPSGESPASVGNSLAINHRVCIQLAIPQVFIAPTIFGSHAFTPSQHSKGGMSGTLRIGDRINCCVNILFRPKKPGCFWSPVGRFWPLINAFVTEG